MLKLSEAEDLAAQLNELLSFMARSTPTPAAPAMGLWAWRSDPLLDDDLLVAAGERRRHGHPSGRAGDPDDPCGVHRHPCGGPCSRQPTDPGSAGRLQWPAAQVQSLISSLKKVVRSALEQRRTDVYIPTDQPTPALYLIS